jgi:hypothetical protein
VLQGFDKGSQSLVRLSTSELFDTELLVNGDEEVNRSVR